MDGSAPAAATPATPRDARRDAGSLHRRNSNRKGGICRRLRRTAKGKPDRSEAETAESMLRPAGPRSGLLSVPSFRARQQLQQCFGDRGEIRGRGQAARVNHNIPSWGNLLSMQPYNFPYPAPDAVAPHRGSQRLFDAPAEAADALTVGADENSELAARPAAPFAIHRIVLAAAHQSTGARKWERWRIKRA